MRLLECADGFRRLSCRAIVMAAAHRLALALLIITSDVTLNLFAHFYLRLHLKPLTLSLQLIFFLAVVAAISYARATGPATRTI